MKSTYHSRRDFRYEISPGGRSDLVGVQIAVFGRDGRRQGGRFIVRPALQIAAASASVSPRRRRRRRHRFDGGSGRHRDVAAAVAAATAAAAIAAAGGRHRRRRTHVADRSRLVCLGRRSNICRWFNSHNFILFYF